MTDSERKKVLVTVKTYPTPAHKGAEVSCTAGITDDQKWIRLFPIPFRYMEGSQRFKKYQWVELNVNKAQSDSRKESHEVDVNSIKILGEPLSTENAWETRKKYVLPLMSPSLCYLQRTLPETGNTIGIFKPRIIQKLVVQRDTLDWTPAEREKLFQPTVHDHLPFAPLEKIPYKFSYKFECQEQGCKGHELLCVDWELGESWRQWKRKYGDDWYWPLIKRYETDMALIKDTCFYVGTVHQYPSSWIIIGLFYPPFLDAK
jgi:hypothetical protein